MSDDERRVRPLTLKSALSDMIHTPAGNGGWRVKGPLEFKDDFYEIRIAAQYRQNEHPHGLPYEGHPERRESLPPRLIEAMYRFRKGVFWQIDMGGKRNLVVARFHPDTLDRCYSVEDFYPDE